MQLPGKTTEVGIWGIGDYLDAWNQFVPSSNPIVKGAVFCQQWILLGVYYLGMLYVVNIFPNLLCLVDAIDLAGYKSNKYTSKVN